MIRWIVSFFIVALFSSINLFAQTDTTQEKSITAPPHTHFRISLITGSSGVDIFETFGHSCIRVIDSEETGGNRDRIYNYGFYDEFTSSYLSQWLNGRVRTFLETTTYENLCLQFDEEKRKLIEQELLLTTEQKQRVVAYMQDNMKKVTRYYEYDTFYDNCTTRLRDMFVKLFGASFVPGNALPANSQLKFRDFSSNMYCPVQHKYWFGLILNLFFASRADRVMSNNDAMFNPEYFAKIMGMATLDGKKMCGSTVVLYTDRATWSSAFNEPLVISIAIALLTICAFLYTKKPVFAKVMSLILLFFTGLLGCYMVYFWMMDCEPAWKENYNILWALPTNLLIPFFKPRIRRIYAVLALLLIGAAIVLHIAGVQEMPLFEITFLLLSLIFVYTAMYKRAALPA